MKAPEPADGAVQAYERAHSRFEIVQSAWDREGRPLTYQQPNHVLCPHPLWKMVLESERALAKAREAARVKHRGPAPRAVISQTIGESPAARLRS
jgi:hypothetical protein